MPEHRLHELRAGNRRFVGRHAPAATSDRRPVAVLSCIDGRVPVDAIFDLPSARIYSVRTAGNVVGPDVTDSLELACSKGGAALIVVLGHTGCVAVRTATESASPRSALLDKIQPAIQAVGAVGETSASEFVDAVAAENVEHSVAAIIHGSDTVRALVAAGAVRVIGAMYDVQTGEVTFLDPPGPEKNPHARRPL